MAPPFIRDRVIQIIEGNFNVVPTPFEGGVWNRLPQAGTGPGSTPGAFYTSAESTKLAGKLKDTISVVDVGESPAANGEGRDGFSAFPMVYGFAANSASGTAALALLDERLHAYFRRGLHYARGDDAGTGLDLLVLERQPLRDADDLGYPGYIFTVWRIQGTFIKP